MFLYEVISDSMIAWHENVFGWDLHEMVMAAFESIIHSPAFWMTSWTNLSPPRIVLSPVYYYVNQDNPHDPNLKKQLVQNRCPSDTRDSIMNKVGSIEPFKNPLDTRKLESSSYHALGACFVTIYAFLRLVDLCQDDMGQQIHLVGLRTLLPSEVHKEIVF
ncbi:hypothetical protein Tco_0411902 [Tanacetum coccineum]